MDIKSAMRKHPLGIFIPVAVAILLGTLFSFMLRHYFGPANEGRPFTASTAAVYASSFPDTNGQMQTLQQWKGKIAVINFWATWCPPCREEMPELSDLQEKYKDQGVVVIGISTDTVDKIRDFVAESPVSYALLAGDTQAMDLSEQLGNTKSALPYTVIVRADGTIATTYFGRIDTELLEKTLIPLLNASKEAVKTTATTPD